MYEWEVVGLERLADITDLPRTVKRAASRAINRTADRARTQSSREIRQQVAFPASYLSPSGGRLAVAQQASETSLEARIRARYRATSLARFITRTGPRGRGVTVEVKPGHSVDMPGAFLISLRGGVDSKGNRGLALRLKKGQSLRNRMLSKQMAKGLYVLYGPSVYQVARTVFVDVAGNAARFLETEFERQLRLLSR